MAAYAVIARIERAEPHLAGWADSGRLDDLDLDMRHLGSVEPVETAQTPELIERPFPPGLAERWADIRETWAQATFYLLNAEGWR